MKTETIPIADIQADPTIQVRAGGTPEATAQEYADVLRAGTTLPPLVVYRDLGGINWLADGFTRRRAHEIADLDQVLCEVREGDRRAALLHAIGANASHGLPRTSEDKRNAVRLLLADPEWSRMSVAEIARTAKVSGEFARRLVAEHEASISHAGDAPPATRTTSDGRQYPAHLQRRSSEADEQGASPTEGDAQADDRPRQTTKADSLKDATGRVVPADLRDHFGDPMFADLLDAAGKLHATAHAFGVHLQRLLTGKGHAWAQWLKSVEAANNAGRAEGAVENVIAVLEAGRPYAVCEACEGDGCEDCRQAGWVPEWRHKELHGGKAAA